MLGDFLTKCPVVCLIKAKRIFGLGSLHLHMKGDLARKICVLSCLVWKTMEESAGVEVLF